MSCNGCIACDDQPFGVEIHTADGVEIKQMVIPKAGTFVPQHSHTYDHMSMLAKGSVLVSIDGCEPKKHVAPAGIFIPAQIKHLFQSLEDETIIYCIHNTSRNGTIDVAQEHQIVEV